VTDRTELESLRLSVARVAQELGIEHEIPGYHADVDTLALPRTHERGWNRLCACIIDAIERRQ
jgi:hypothetical protein